MSDTPCEIWFYHLERTGPDQVLPELLEKTLSRGWRALVRSPLPERLEHLDGWLWSYRDDAFLPHGLEGEPFAERQPILLTRKLENPTAAQALFLLDGASTGELDGFARCVLIFDGRDEATLGAARASWTAFKREGRPISYWRQAEAGGWRNDA
jgi:DNA polymerase-3 subunit chi